MIDHKWRNKEIARICFLFIGITQRLCFDYNYIYSQKAIPTEGNDQTLIGRGE